MSYHWIPQRRDQHLPPHFTSSGRIAGNEIAHPSPILQTSDFSASVPKHLDSNTAHVHTSQLCGDPDWMPGTHQRLSVIPYHSRTEERGGKEKGLMS